MRGYSTGNFSFPTRGEQRRGSYLQAKNQDQKRYGNQSQNVGNRRF